MDGIFAVLKRPNPSKSAAVSRGGAETAAVAVAAANPSTSSNNRAPLSAPSKISTWGSASASKKTKKKKNANAKLASVAVGGGSNGQCGQPTLIGLAPNTKTLSVEARQETDTRVETVDFSAHALEKVSKPKQPVPGNDDGFGDSRGNKPRGE
ncbi:hypothetical protein BASA61_007489 [Batrachochytrium salamandrivorans]|nr:hypothetical protein BASA62_002985 [Batrachochytrium salamandrivorans]KAH6584402.1 hypothetical protein BASA61_007489 [Batrachochytrium salamandrivorans]KAJ1339943.1 hypothetical protein BSLG_005478 [Batrachochytrium salamandrivorans]